MTSTNYIYSDLLGNNKVLGVRTSTWLLGKHNSTHKQIRMRPRTPDGERDGEMKGKETVDGGECLLLKSQRGKVKRQREDNDPPVLSRLIHPVFPELFLVYAISHFWNYFPNCLLPMKILHSFLGLCQIYHLH